MRRRLFARTWKVPEGTTLRDGDKTHALRGITLGPGRWTWSQRQSDVLFVTKEGQLLPSGAEILRYKTIFGRVWNMNPSGYPQDRNSVRLGTALRELSNDPSLLYSPEVNSGLHIPRKER